MSAADFQGPENGAAAGSELWTDDEPARPMSIGYAERARAAQKAAGAGDPSSGTTDPAAPVPVALPILPPDEWEMLKRIEKLEAAVANQESVIAMCVYVATTAADRAKGAV